MLLDPMFEIPGSDVVGVHITEDAVNGLSPPVYIRGKPVAEHADQEPEEAVPEQARAEAK